MSTRNLHMAVILIEEKIEIEGRQMRKVGHEISKKTYTK